MPEPTSVPALPARSWSGRILLFLLLVLSLYTLPNKPSIDLDASWRMALGQFFLDGLQFGRDVVFTYGPLGFLMGKTYYGSAPLFHALLLWQLFTAVTFTGLIMLWGERLAGRPRFFYYLFFVIFGVTYEDAAHMIVIALIGFELLRRLGRPGSWIPSLLVALLALLGAIKFTNLMLGLGAVLVCAGHECWQRRWRDALRFVACFAGAYLLIWVLCRQSLLALPEYFRNSWYISQGYQAVMGIPTPAPPFQSALWVLGLLLVYLTHTLWTHPDRARTLARGAFLGAFVYMNWKHGFVRADGHMLGFFYCALLPIVAFPVLLDEERSSARRWKFWLLGPAGFLCVLGSWQALSPVVEYALATAQRKVWTNVAALPRLANLRAEYDEALAQERQQADLSRIAGIVGRSTVDVLGYNQGVALLNGFNYTPRPVLQSYSAYTPELARLNADFFLSAQAPEFVLVKIGSIDSRLSAMDDSAALDVIAHRYEYTMSEKGFHLWRKKPGPLSAEAFATRPLADFTMPIGQSHFLKDQSAIPLWVQADIEPSWLGRLRNFLYKPPHIYLEVEDTAGTSSTYRMPAPIGRAGFIVNPLIDDLMGFVNFTSDRPGRNLSRFAIKITPGDEKYFKPDARIRLSRLATSLNGRSFFTQINRDRFYMFPSVPTAYEAKSGLSEEEIDGKVVMIMHAPSELTFDCPPSATTITGQFGFLKTAYTDGNNTNGAEFTIIWSNGFESITLYRRFLDPIHQPPDRGLQEFKIEMPTRAGGHLYFKIDPGPNHDPSWDWVGWTGIEIK